MTISDVNDIGKVCIHYCLIYSTCGMWQWGMSFVLSILYFEDLSNSKLPIVQSFIICYNVILGLHKMLY